MAFLTSEDFNTRVYQEKIDAISNGDDTLLPTAISGAISEVEKLLVKFDLDDLFGKTGDDRDPILLIWLKDIAIWHFIGLSNPGIDYEDSLSRYQQAIKSLTAIKGSTDVPLGWKLRAVTDTDYPAGTIEISSQCKRDTYR
ncbi:hypothetical protein [Mucilaginibacter sp. L3T2-6]|uniref:hypothetical protein n=1 Tax=Mucilaginibacter sp. L3T2-6 TaxID=3062491 RepID=UPI00267686F5|nr:hypothetical protein [Mucilaginibacter sp. L3T2-6]MDO3641966.1 hypothetical protein [Mucilaginibacter sp. L3T2-6]MDV6214356.1 hypothetical protein [Mucilaginibacter sp. L3T2-6]